MSYHTNTLVIGASIAGLASAGCLTHAGIEHIVIEKADKVAFPWRQHYERLHLHTSKKLSALPYLPFPASAPKYPSRAEVVEYLESYQRKFNIQPHFNKTALEITPENDGWVVRTNDGIYRAKNVIVATGVFGKPRTLQVEGMESFAGPIVHSFDYRSGRDYKGQQVLVIGFGNSACEIAIDLHEQGAFPSMSVRSAVNVLPRDLFGIPILQLGVLTAKLPYRLVDKLNAPMIKFLLGDIEKLGLKKLPYGPLEQIHRYQQVPLLDIGTLQLIREGAISIYTGIDRITEHTVYFKDGKQSNFDAIIAAIGYEKGYQQTRINVGQHRFDDLENSIDNQRYFGEDGLYFCGFWVSPTGQIREISLDAKKIVAHIQNRQG